MRGMKWQRLVPAFFLCAGLALLPWTIWLTLSLPAHHESENWRTVWAGFDTAEAAALIATALAAICFWIALDDERALLQALPPWRRAALRAIAEPATEEELLATFRDDL